MFAKAMTILVLGTLLLSGCGKVAEKAIERAAGVTVDKQGDSVTITGKGGQQATFGGQLPEELKSFPVPQGFDGESGISASQGSDKMATGSWKGKGSVQAASDFYKSTLPALGWRQEAATDTGIVSLLSFSKGDTSANITITKLGDDVLIAVVSGNKKTSGASR
ncbi:MAG: hypothetical protein HYX94_05410 [Chloroflexi bacterium]|nr:hypothetical protein [Chloroflexota bacterium]